MTELKLTMMDSFIVASLILALNKSISVLHIWELILLYYTLKL